MIAGSRKSAPGEETVAISVTELNKLYDTINELVRENEGFKRVLFALVAGSAGNSTSAAAPLVVGSSGKIKTPIGFHK